MFLRAQARLPEGLFTMLTGLTALRILFLRITLRLLQAEKRLAGLFTLIPI